MKRTIIIAISLFFSGFELSYGQAVVVDPVLTSSVLFAGISNQTELNLLNQRLVTINGTQITTAATLVLIQNIQKQIYNGLSQVSTALSNGLDIYNATNIVTDIITYQIRVITLAGDDPLLLAFAVKMETEFYTKATGIVTELSGVAFTGGKTNLMDSGQRTYLIHKIIDDLRVMRSVSYMAYSKMYYANRIGILTALNPFQGYINQDKAIIQRIRTQYRQF